MNSAALLARMNFGVALAQNRVPGVKVDTSQFKGETPQIERRHPERGRLLPDAKAAIDAGMEQRLTTTISTGDRCG